MVLGFLDLRKKRVFWSLVHSIVLSVSCSSNTTSTDKTTTDTAAISESSTKNSTSSDTDSSSSSDDSSNSAANTIANIKKSSTNLNLVGQIMIDNSILDLTSGNKKVKCVDALDGTVYSTVTVETDGSFKCIKIPQCYDDKSCVRKNPTQVLVVDADTGGTISVGSAGQLDLVGDIGSCFASAQSALDGDAKACLTKVNMAASTNVFQSALNAAYAKGQIPLNRYTLASCLALTDVEKLSALENMVDGSLASVLISNLDSQMQTELFKCDSNAGQGRTNLSMLNDFLTMGFTIPLYGSVFEKDLADPKSLASELNTYRDEIKLAQISIANGNDPKLLVDSGKIHKEVLLYQLNMNCSYTSKREPTSLPMELNANATDFKACAKTISKSQGGDGKGGSNKEMTLTFAGESIGTSLTFPNINNPQGDSNNGDGDKGGIPFQFEGFKIVTENSTKTFSLNDLYKVFFQSQKGLLFRSKVDVHSGNDNQSYLIDKDGKTVSMTDSTDMSSEKFVPSFDSVFGFLTNKAHPFDLVKILQAKVHRNYNPTGQESFYVTGKKVSGTDLPITCDIVDSEGDSVGMKIEGDIKVSCVATNDTATMKSYFVGGFSDSYLRLINKNNGQEIRTSTDSPILLQDSNLTLDGDMPSCKKDNEILIYKYVSLNQNDQWLNDRVIKTICFDFSTIKNAAEYNFPYHVEQAIGKNTWPNSLLAGKNNSGDVKPLCLASGSVTVADNYGCMNEAKGTFAPCSDPTDSSTCSCAWENGENMRNFSSLTVPADKSLALTECSDSSAYYLAPYWGGGNITGLASLNVNLMDAGTGSMLQAFNDNFDPAITQKYLSDAFSACKESKWCWMKDQIKDYAAVSDIPSEQSWMKRDVVRFYCMNNQDDATLKADCKKLEPTVQITLPLSKFSNVGNKATASVYEVYNNKSYFSNMSQPNPNYNKVFDYKTFTYKYGNYDPFCDDINKDGLCNLGDDIFFSDIWNFDNSLSLMTDVAGLTGYKEDLAHVLFPQEPKSWEMDTWNSYINPVMMKIGGASALACSNDRSIKISWNNMRFGPDDGWKAAKPDVCGADDGYFVVRDIKTNDNTYLVEQPELVQTLLTMALGSTSGTAIDPKDKRFDFVQAMSIFMISMDIPPVYINDDGSYAAFYPTIDGVLRKDVWTGYMPVGYNGDLKGPIVDLFMAIPE